MHVSSFQQQYGPWALVTGASSGIGAEFCRRLAGKGINLVMVARRQDRMDALAEELRNEHGIQVKVVPVDLSKNDFLSALLPEIDSLEIGLLINNAGFGVGGPFLTNNLERELALLNVNYRAPLILTHEIGQQMMERKKGGIIFLSSVLGYMATPFFANYAASKAFNLYMGEALWYELKQHGVDVLVLSPGTTKTEFGRVSGMGRVAAMSVEPVVTAAFKQLGKKPSVVSGIHNRLVVTWFKIIPRWIGTALIGSIMKRTHKFQE